MMKKVHIHGGVIVKIEIENIGKISEAQIELNGITVIAGENNSAKSTIGKVLYAVFNSFYGLEEQIYNDKLESITRIIGSGIETPRFLMQKNNEAFKFILNNADYYISHQGQLLSDIIDTLNRHEFKDLLHFVEDEKMLKHNVSEIIKKIIPVLEFSNERILKRVISTRMKAEFNEQINNIHFPDHEGFITLNIRNKDIKIKVKNNDVIELSNQFNLNTEVIYIDDPYVLDNLRNYPRYLIPRMTLKHREHLRVKLLKKSSNNVLDELLIEDQLKNIFDKLNEVCAGEMINYQGEYGYKTSKSKAILNIENISSGLKTFVIIKRLFQNGSLEYNGTIILDEPEIHLHPQWQLILAEVIVLLQKEFNMHILLNTHSPYFLRAIEVYAGNHGIADKCKYYLSKNENSHSTFQDVTMKTDLVYRKLASPLEQLQFERYKND